jgi:tetratricopeptide (TPR) repeat protein
VPNVLVVLAWALEHQRAELACQLASDLGAYWWRTSQWEAGLPWIDAAVERSCDASNRAQATVLLSRARLISMRQQQRYRADLLASLELFRSCHDDGGIAACLGHLANAEAWHGRFEKASALSDEAVRFAVREHDDEAIALALGQRVSTTTGYDDVSRHARTAIDHLQRVGNLYEIAHTCVLTGYLAIAERRYRDALAWLTEASHAGRKLGDAKSLFLVRSNQGLAWLFVNEIDQAADAFHDALAVCREACCEHLLDEVLLGLAAVAARRGRLTRAAHLAGAANAHETASQAVSQVAVWARLNDEMLTAPRQEYGTEKWQRAGAETASVTVDEAIDLALERGRFAPARPGRTAPSEPDAEPRYFT